MLHLHDTQTVHCDFTATETKGQLLEAELSAVLGFWPSIHHWEPLQPHRTAALEPFSVKHENCPNF